MRNNHQNFKPICWTLSRKYFPFINTQNCFFKPIGKLINIFHVIENTHAVFVTTTKILSWFDEPLCPNIFSLIYKKNWVFKPIRKLLNFFRVKENNHFACVTTTKIFTWFAEPLSHLLLISSAIFRAYIHKIVFLNP